MSEEISKDRSPRSPAVSLQNCVEYITKMHGQCRRNPVDPETAVKAMGFKSLHGAALTLLAGLREYGLVDRPAGKVALTALAVKIVHPISDEQHAEALKEAALSPKLFATLLGDFGDCSESVLESHLVQTGFNPERAKQVAKVFISNKAFAKLDAGSKTGEPDEDKGGEVGRDGAGKTPGSSGTLTALPPQPPGSILTPPAGNSFSFKGEMLAQYNIPLGENQAHLAFTGRELVPEDFDALIEYVELFKKQFVRKVRVSEKSQQEKDAINDFATYHPGAQVPGEEEV